MSGHDPRLPWSNHKQPIGENARRLLVIKPGSNHAVSRHAWRMRSQAGLDIILSRPVSTAFKTKIPPEESGVYAFCIVAS